MALRIGSDVLMVFFSSSKLCNHNYTMVISHFAIKVSLARNSESLSIVNVNKEKEIRKADKA